MKDRPKFRVGDWAYIHWPGNALHGCKVVINRVEFGLSPTSDRFAISVPSGDSITLRLYSTSLVRESDRIVPRGQWSFWDNFIYNLCKNGGLS